MSSALSAPLFRLVPKTRVRTNKEAQEFDMPQEVGRDQLQQLVAQGAQLVKLS
jgi:hypothetical protein